VRQLPAVLVAAATSAFGALLLGEYDLGGATGVFAGALFGVAVAEAARLMAKGRVPTAAAAVIAAIAGAGMVWATFISTNRFRSPIPTAAYVGIAASVMLAGAWLRSSGRREPSSPSRS
jgi:hypothetical protein